MAQVISGYGVSYDLLRIREGPPPTLGRKKTMLATQPDTDTIAITRTFDGIETAAHRVISQIGGMASVIKDSKMAVLKPNFVAGRSAGTGATTDFALLKAVAEEVRSCGAEPVLYEVPG